MEQIDSLREEICRTAPKKWTNTSSLLTGKEIARFINDVVSAASSKVEELAQAAADATEDKCIADAKSVYDKTMEELTFPVSETEFGERHTLALERAKEKFHSTDLGAKSSFRYERRLKKLEKECNEIRDRKKSKNENRARMACDELIDKERDILKSFSKSNMDRESFHKECESARRRVEQATKGYMSAQYCEIKATKMANEEKKIFDRRHSANPVKDLRDQVIVCAIAAGLMGLLLSKCFATNTACNVVGALFFGCVAVAVFVVLLLDERTETMLKETQLEISPGTVLAAVNGRTIEGIPVPILATAAVIAAVVVFVSFSIFRSKSNNN